MRFFWPQFQEKVSVLSKRKARKIELIDEIKRNDAYNTITLIRRRCSRLLISCLATFFFLQYAYYVFWVTNCDALSRWAYFLLHLLLGDTILLQWGFITLQYHINIYTYYIWCKYAKGCKMSVYISYSMTKFVMRSNKKRYKKQCPLLFLEI